MTLNYIWLGFFLIAFVVALVKLVFFQDYQVFTNMLTSTFDMSTIAFELALKLTGLMALWLGIMKIGERGGMIAMLSKLVGPFFSKLFPGIPKNHPAMGALIMNFSANLLGLDNAATPLGLKAMSDMQELNLQKDTASDAQIMFLVLNTSGLSIIPLTVMLDRSIMSAANPTDIFIPIMLATFCSTIVGLLVVSFIQKINLLDKVILSYLVGITLFMASVAYYFFTLPPEDVNIVSTTASSIIIFGVIISFLGMASFKKINVFEAFIDGAKEGFEVAIKIIPYLVAFLVAIGVFRASGALNYLTDGIGYIIGLTGADTDFVPALPTALMKPLSGSGAKGMMMETMEIYGADSFVGRMASIFRGATETTFYIIAVYFGSVNIKKIRYAVGAGLAADVAGIIAAIFIGYLFFH